MRTWPLRKKWLWLDFGLWTCGKYLAVADGGGECTVARFGGRASRPTLGTILILHTKSDVWIYGGSFQFQIHILILRIPHVEHTGRNGAPDLEDLLAIIHHSSQHHAIFCSCSHSQHHDVLPPSPSPSPLHTIPPPPRVQKHSAY